MHCYIISAESAVIIFKKLAAAKQQYLGFVGLSLHWESLVYQPYKLFLLHHACSYFENLHWVSVVNQPDKGGVSLHKFMLNMLSFMFRFMLSNVCYHNTNQRSFLKLHFLIKFMFRVMFELYLRRDRKKRCFSF